MNRIFIKMMRNVQELQQKNKEMIQHILEDFNNSPYLKKSDFIGCYFGEVTRIQSNAEHLEQNIRILEEIEGSKIEKYQLQGICNKIIEDFEPLEKYHIWNKENSRINEIALAGN